MTDATILAWHFRRMTAVRHHTVTDREAEERDAAAIDAAEDARADAEHLAQLDLEEATLRDEIEAGDRDHNGTFIPWPRYPR